MKRQKTWARKYTGPGTDPPVGSVPALKFLSPSQMLEDLSPSGLGLNAVEEKAGIGF